MKKGFPVTVRRKKNRRQRRRRSEREMEQKKRVCGQRQRMKTKITKEGSVGVGWDKEKYLVENGKQTTCSILKHTFYYFREKTLWNISQQS